MNDTANPSGSRGTFDSQVAVVTGGSGAIGRAIAVGLAAQKAAVCLLGRNEQKLRESAEVIARFGGVVHTLRADLADDGDMKNVGRELGKKFGRIDVLVHSAGMYRRAEFLKSSLEDFDLLYRVNVRGPYSLTQSLLPMLLASRGQIVFINSSQGTNAGACVSQYAATQHAKKALADSLREEVNQLGVRVISVFPGRTASNMTRNLYELQGREYVPQKLMQPSDISDVVTNALSLPRTAEVTNIFMRPMEKSY